MGISNEQLHADCKTADIIVKKDDQTGRQKFLARCLVIRYSLGPSELAKKMHWALMKNLAD